MTHPTTAPGVGRGDQDVVAGGACPGARPTLSLSIARYPVMRGQPIWLRRERQDKNLLAF